MWRMESKYRLSDFSSQSVICAVDKFMQSVEAMNDTVMVPSRLLDVEPPEKGESVPILLRGSSDPYTFYTILNNVKNNLVWGITDNEKVQVETSEKLNNNHSCSTWFVPSTNGKISGEAETEKTTKGHARKISSVSTASVVSAMSEQECERLSDAGDSGVESEEVVDPCTEVTAALKTHLLGLQTCLAALTETATYVTEIYQEEVSI